MTVMVYPSILFVFANIENSNPFDRIRKQHHFRIRERAAGIVIAALPVLCHHSSGKEEVLGDALVASGAINQVDDVANLLVRLLLQSLGILTLPKFIGKLLHKVGDCDTKLLCLLVLMSRCPSSARIHDVLVAHVHLGQIMWQRPGPAPKVDLERERVFSRLAVERPLQWSVGNKSTVPVIFPIDFGGRKAGRQRTAGHDMLWPYAIGCVVEIGKVPSTDVHGAHTEAHATGIDPVEIHQALEGRLQRRSIVVAGLVRRVRGPQRRRWHTRSKKIRSAKQEDIHGSSLIDKVMNERILQFDGFEIWDTYRRRADGLPEFAKALHTLVRGIAGDDC